jgi:steroid 5-alpha reductase family enzyme
VTCYEGSVSDAADLKPMPPNAAASAPDRTRAAALVTLSYVLALAAAIAAACVTPGGPIVRGLVGDVAATLVVFAFSLAFDNSSFYDPYWSVAPPVLGAYWWWHAGARTDVRTILVLLLVTAWAVRLTWNWTVGWRGLGHEDWRYVDIRAKTGRAYWPASLAGIHMFPTVQVFLGCLALYAALTGRAPLSFLDGVAAFVTLAAIVVEAVADAQLRRFTSQAARAPGAIMEQGLWAFSRHPNYFGEALFWWGLVAFAAAAQPLRWWHAAGALAISAMFALVSIPLMEKRSLARRPEYALLQRRVSMIVPWFRRRT